jgi:hypothetical protein
MAQPIPQSSSILANQSVTHVQHVLIRLINDETLAPLSPPPSNFPSLQFLDNDVLLPKLSQGQRSKVFWLPHGLYGFR